MTAGDLIEILAAVCGVLGTMMLAAKGKHAGWGFVLYLLSNGGWLAFAITHGHVFLMLQTLVFTCTSLYGIWTWLLRPHCTRSLQ